ncbi:hypothetical protein ACDQ55_21235 [Chitinophaga sp. 30R24]|uniref:hypothetical protein n=1 Tax=Chitinophaga sp. 30R24 TaxID=3248838 RepID=UPI003B8FECA0
MKYFNNCNTIEEVKTLYKKLAKENHPDMGGDTATMQEISTEYAFACVFIAKGAGLNDAEIDQELKLSEEYKAIIEKIISLPGIHIELVGNWIWITGNTKPVHKQLLGAKFRIAKKRLLGITETKHLGPGGEAHHSMKYVENMGFIPFNLKVKNPLIKNKTIHGAVSLAPLILLLSFF